MKRKAENATRRCRIVLFKQFEISLSVERKLLFPNGECRRGAFTTGARTKLAAYKLVINADLPRPLSNKCSTGHYSGSSRFLWIWKQFAPTTNPPLYPLLFLSADTPDINPRTTIITILTNWNIRGARVQIAAGNEGRRRFRFGRNFFLLHRDSGFEGVRWLI